MSDGATFPLELVQHIAKLAALSLSADETEAFATDLGKIVGYVGELSAVDTTGIAPMSHGGVLENALRPDEEREGVSHEDALRAAPETADGGFVVPTFVEG